MNKYKLRNLLNVKTWFFVFFIIIFLGITYFYFFKKERILTIEDSDNCENYENIMDDNDFSNEENMNKVQLLIKQNHNVYGVLESLNLSKYYVTKNKFNLAIDVLQNVLKWSKDNSIINLIHFRVAKLHFELREFKKALLSISFIQESSWTSSVCNLKGDIFFALGNKESAIKFWKISYFLEKNVYVRNFLHMKIFSFRKHTDV
ncbi:YfgM family protein [Buchnera aphidicola]|uniref:Ancillary SecYEG translocon subunit n=1 Tax=Buchnera aphidicola (Anoecia oenotherae) TaxID=1241833 RepID=A0A4D6Y570_9GAMM|nr:tetratricopeptide repeat protein [Buchnera aphidicola]QCI19575.1 hypothetical protein D9V65_02435 [Buchnera aphidicola (Anoecia oenotherae)]